MHMQFGNAVTTGSDFICISHRPSIYYMNDNTSFLLLSAQGKCVTTNAVKPFCGLLSPCVEQRSGAAKEAIRPTGKTADICRRMCGIGWLEERNSISTRSTFTAAATNFEKPRSCIERRFEWR